MGAGLRPKAKGLDKPPDPTVRAPVLDPTVGGLMEKARKGPRQEPTPPEGASVSSDRSGQEPDDRTRNGMVPD